MTDSYVYIIFRPTGEPCYVGRGKGGRWKKHARGQNKHLRAIYALANGDLPVIKVREGLTEKESKETEIAFIAALGRECDGGPLVNLSTGGEGSSGIKMSFEWRKNRSEKAKEAWNDPKFRADQIARMMGNKFTPKERSPEWRAKISLGAIGNKSRTGQKRSPGECERQSLAAQKKWADPEWRAAQMTKRRAPGGAYHPDTVKATQEKRLETLRKKRIDRGLST